MGWVAFVVIGWFIYGLLVNFGAKDEDGEYYDHDDYEDYDEGEEDDEED